ncbi:MAG: hypothetical protein JO314_13475 [Acidobacteria bacterium]|nr:hypothetical protein [Acidobacteriota bacterium]
MFLLLASCGVVNAQVDAERDKDKEITLGRLILTIPSYFVDQKMKAIEGGGWRFKRNDMTLDIDDSGYAGVPTFELRDPRYDHTEEDLTVNGLPAKFWTLRGSFQAGANYLTAGKRILFVSLLGAENKKGQIAEIARKIFLSVRIKDSSSNSPSPSH